MRPLPEVTTWCCNANVLKSRLFFISSTLYGHDRGLGSIIEYIISMLNSWDTKFMNNTTLLLQGSAILQCKACRIIDSECAWNTLGTTWNLICILSKICFFVSLEIDLELLGFPIDIQGNVAVPADLSGQVYAVASTSGTDNTLVAGPAILLFERNSTGKGVN